MDITNTPLRFELRRPQMPDGRDASGHTLWDLCLEGEPRPLATIIEHDDEIAKAIANALNVVEYAKRQAHQARVVLERRYEFGSTVTPSKTKDDNPE